VYSWVDLEGFGDSEGRGNMMGWVGARDIHAAIEYLQGRPDVDPERIGGLGLSMGGEVLLQAAGESPDLRAVVSEGGTGRTAADFKELDDEWFELIVPFQAVLGASMRVVSGESAPPPLKELVPQIGPNRVLVIAANIDEEIELMRLYVEIGGPSFEMWTIPEPKHVGAYDLHPGEYEQRVIAFFDDALVGGAAGNSTGR
jgi:pimeloyl-ACP methyl ester carboxylesterase